MSAANYYQPHVYIAGRKLAESAPADGPAVIADFTITWGAADWYSNVDPAILRLTINDPLGEVLGTAQGSSILITRDPDQAVVFDGTVDEVTSRYGKSTDPRTGELRDMWKHTISAYDPLGACARDRRRGPLYPDSRATVRNLHWGNCYMDQRQTDIRSRSPVGFSWPETIIDFTNVYRTNGQFVLFPPVNGYETNQVVSLLTVIRNTARAIGPTYRPYYRPDTRRIHFYDVSTRRQGALQNVPSPFYVALEEDADDGAHVTLRGSDLIQGDGISVSSGAVVQTTRLELGIKMPMLEKDENGRIRVAFTDQPLAIEAVPKAGSQLTIQADCDVCYEFMQDTAVSEGPVTLTVEDMFELSATRAIEATYGLPTLPPFVYRFDKHAAAPAWALPWLLPAPIEAAYGDHTVYRLIESQTSLIPSMTTFSIVGGTLRYSHERGWIADLNPALQGYPGGDPALRDFTSTARLNTVDDRSTIADWQHLQIAN